jgi:hypothetical protein
VVINNSFMLSSNFDLANTDWGNTYRSNFGEVQDDIFGAYTAAELTPLRETPSICAIASYVRLKAPLRILSRARSSQQANL